MKTLTILANGIGSFLSLYVNINSASISFLIDEDLEFWEMVGTLTLIKFLVSSFVSQYFSITNVTINSGLMTEFSIDEFWEMAGTLILIKF